MIFKKALNKHIPWFTLAFITVSLSVSMIIGVSCYLFYALLFNAEAKDPSLAGENYLVLNKTVGMLNMFSGNGVSFSDQEIEDLKSQDFINEVAPFEAAEFRVKAYAPLHENRSFYTDLPLESVPHQFLDVGQDFHWSEGQAELPIVIPRVYFSTYNFAFAPSQDLPQISETTAKSLLLKMEMIGEGGTYTFWARIHDFTDRVNTILVPQEFMDWSNTNIGKAIEKPPSRIIISSPEAIDDRLQNYISKKGYSTNQELLKDDKLTGLLKGVLSLESFQGVLILCLSIVLLLLSSALLVVKNKSAIYKLRLQGISKSQITRHYFKFFSLCIGISMVVSLAVYAFLRSTIVSVLTELGLSLSHSFLMVLITILGLGALSALLSYFTIRKRVSAVV